MQNTLDIQRESTTILRTIGKRLELGGNNLYNNKGDLIMTKYIISRASLRCDEDTPPCKGAVKELLDTYVYSTCTKEELVKKHIIKEEDLKDWENVKNGESRRKTKKWYYTIEIENLEEFINSLGEQVIVTPCGYNFRIPYGQLEIYDDWIE